MRVTWCLLGVFILLILGEIYPIKAVDEIVDARRKRDNQGPGGIAKDILKKKKDFIDNVLEKKKDIVDDILVTKKEIIGDFLNKTKYLDELKKKKDALRKKRYERLRRRKMERLKKKKLDSKKIPTKKNQIFGYLSDTYVAGKHKYNQMLEFMDSPDILIERILKDLRDAL